MDTSSISMYAATHAMLRALPLKSSTAAINYYFVPVLEIDLEVPLKHLGDLVATLIQAHPILRARYDREHQLVIRDQHESACEYSSWDMSVQKIRHAILAMFERPLFHIVAHSEAACCGCARRLTVVWHHLITDNFSKDIIRWDIAAVIRGDTLPLADLSLYKRIARHPIAALPIQSPPYEPFTLRACRTFISSLGNVIPCVTMFAAVAQQNFPNDMARVRMFLDSFCQVTRQREGRFGLVTNARARLDEDASRLIGALLYNLEYTYDSATRKLMPCNCSQDITKPGLIINMRTADEDAESIIAMLGFESPQQVVDGIAHASIKRMLAGAFGTNFADGKQVYMECIIAHNATVYVGIVPNTIYDARDQVQSLQRLLSSCKESSSKHQHQVRKMRGYCGGAKANSPRHRRGCVPAAAQPSPAQLGRRRNSPIRKSI
jgi:hypothetical protein